MKKGVAAARRRDYHHPSGLRLAAEPAMDHHIKACQKRGRPVMATDRITRRGFVGALGVTAGSAALLGGAGASGAVGPNDKIRIGLIGAGSRGNQVLKTFLENDQVDGPSVVDVDDQHASGTADTIEKKRGQ